MNKIIVLYIKGEEYNPMLEFTSVEKFFAAVDMNEGVPKPDDIIVEAYIDDNLVDRGNTFKDTLAKLKLILQ